MFDLYLFLYFGTAKTLYHSTSTVVSGRKSDIINNTIRSQK